MPNSLSAQEVQSLLAHSTPSWVEALGAALSSHWTRQLGAEVHALPAVVSPAKPAADATAWQHTGCRIELLTAETESAVAVETDRQLTAALIDSQVGASRVAPLRTRGNLTEIERALLHRAAESLRTALNEVFDRLTLTGVALVQSLTGGDGSSSGDNSPGGSSSASALTPTSTLQVRVLDATGLLHLHLDGQQQSLASPPAEPARAEEATAVLAEFRLPASDLAELSVGDVIITDTPADAPIQLHRAGSKPQPVHPGRLGDLKAIQPLRPETPDPPPPAD